MLQNFVRSFMILCACFIAAGASGATPELEDCFDSLRVHLDDAETVEGKYIPFLMRNHAHAAVVAHFYFFGQKFEVPKNDPFRLFRRGGAGEFFGVMVGDRASLLAKVARLDAEYGNNVSFQILRGSGSETPFALPSASKRVPLTAGLADPGGLLSQRAVEPVVLVDGRGTQKAIAYPRDVLSGIDRTTLAALGITLVEDDLGAWAAETVRNARGESPRIYRADRYDLVNNGAVRALETVADYDVSHQNLSLPDDLRAALDACVGGPCQTTDVLPTHLREAHDILAYLTSRDGAGNVREYGFARTALTNLWRLHLPTEAIDLGDLKTAEAVQILNDHKYPAPAAKLRLERAWLLLVNRYLETRSRVATPPVEATQPTQPEPPSKPAAPRPLSPAKARPIVGEQISAALLAVLVKHRGPRHPSGRNGVPAAFYDILFKLKPRLTRDAYEGAKASIKKISFSPGAFALVTQGQAKAVADLVAGSRVLQRVIQDDGVDLPFTPAVAQAYATRLGEALEGGGIKLTKFVGQGAAGSAYQGLPLSVSPSAERQLADLGVSQTALKDAIAKWHGVIMSNPTGGAGRTILLLPGERLPARGRSLVATVVDKEILAITWDARAEGAFYTFLGERQRLESLRMSIKLAGEARLSSIIIGPDVLAEMNLKDFSPAQIESILATAPRREVESSGHACFELRRKDAAEGWIACFEKFGQRSISATKLTRFLSSSNVLVP